LAHRIFSKNEIEENEENPQVSKYDNLQKDIIKREDLTDDFIRTDDIEIIKKDIPERIQLKFGDKNK